MRTFDPIVLDRHRLSQDLDALEALLTCNSALKERNDILPFFEARRHLCAALSHTNSAVSLPDRVATELDLFGDFVCDAARGDSETHAYSLMEFEDAQPYSVLTRPASGKTMKRWSSRFEHGFSQLVDWAWRLSTEGASTHSYRRIFGANDATIHLLLVAGRDNDLTADDLARLRWRANNLSLGAFRMSCLTFHQVLHVLRQRTSAPVLAALMEPGAGSLNPR